MKEHLMDSRILPFEPTQEDVEVYRAKELQLEQEETDMRPWSWEEETWAT